MRYLSNVATLELDTEKCTGCGMCAEVCPHRVFEISGRKSRITDKDLCMECGACEKNCAFDAIKVNEGVGCAAALIGAAISGGEPVCGCDTGDESKGPSCC